MQSTLADKQSIPTVASGNFTAVNNGVYIAVATLTVTDPTPSVGANFIVHVRNGTATIGGVAYASGQDVHRVWHSGSWATSAMPSRAATVTSSRLTEFDASGNLQNSAVQDSVSGGVATLAATLTGNRTYTFPDAAITVAGSASALTSGGVPYVTTGGLLTDAGTLKFASAVLTVGDGTGTPALVLDGAAGAERRLLFRSASVGRWDFYVDSTAESGADAGSAFVLNARTDAGASIGAVMTIVRAAGGAITLARPVTITGTNLTVPNGTAAAPGLRVTGEQSGLYRASSTTLGIAAAGAASVAFGGANGSTFGGYAIFSTPSAGEFGSFLCSGTNSYLLLGGSSGSATGGQVLLYGSTHATKPNFLEFRRGTTVSATFNNGGDLALASTTTSTNTTTGALTVAGGLGVAGAGFFGGTVTSTQNTNASAVGFVASNTNAGTAAESRSNYINDGSNGIAIRSFSSAYSGTVFGITAANLAAVTTSGSGTTAMVVGPGVNVPLIIITNSVERARFAGSAFDIASGGTVTVAGTQVLAARNTGWTAQTAGASKADLGASPTVGQLASFCRSLYDALAGHGLVGT